MSKKIKVILFLIIVVIFLFNNISYGALVDSFKGNPSSFNGGDAKVRKIISAVLDIVNIIGGAVAAAVLGIISIKYMLASAGERAEIKKYAVIYVIGAIILFGATKIVDILYNFATAA